MTFLEIKPLTAEKLNAVVELDHLCFGGLWTRPGYEREIESPSSNLLVLEAHPASREAQDQSQSSAVLTQNSVTVTADGETASTPPNFLVGLGCFWSIVEEAHITILAVHPDYQRQGLGQLLLYALLRDAKRRQLEWATLEVKPSNQAALSLYQKFGFQEAGRRRRYYQDTGEDALILWLRGLQKGEFEANMAKFAPKIAHNITLSGWQMSDSWEDELISSKPPTQSQTY
ncbi:MAG: ribosomal protein S18-alanine N-acetyltransferase [Potamolinea sp.]